MLLDVLRSVSSAGAQTIRTTCGTEPSVGSSGGASTEDRIHCLSAILLGQNDPVKSVVISCDRDLAEHLTQRLMPRASGTDEGNRTAAAFRVFSSIFQRALAAEASWFVPTAEVLHYGPGAIKAEPMGDRFFDMCASTPSGDLHILVNLAVNPSLGAASSPAPLSHTDTAPQATRALTGERLDEVFSALGGGEIDVQLEVPSARHTIELHYATMISRTTREGKDLLLLTLPRRAADLSRVKPGQKLRSFLAHEGRLYQFESPFVGVSTGSLAGGVEIPLLALGVPTELTPGQRRRAFRVRPAGVFAARIERWIVDEKSEVFETDATTHAVIRDISTIGVRLASADDELPVRFVEGNLVLCRLQLDARGAPAEIPGVVRRVERVEHETHPHEVGIELIDNPAWRQFQHSLARVRDFVMAEQRKAARVREN